LRVGLGLDFVLCNCLGLTFWMFRCVSLDHFIPVSFIWCHLLGLVS